MNRKIYRVLLIAALAVALVASLSACSIGNAFGNFGLSAYEIAVKNGYEGTETEWLDSLHTTNTVEKTTNNYNIEVSTAGDVSVAANIGLKSIVSVYCKHNVSVNTWFGQQTQQAQSAGSGVIYQLENDGSAYIITNHHVVYENSATTSNKISNDISVYLYGMEGSAYAIPATYVGGSQN